MSQIMKTYDLSKVRCIVGTFVIGGFAADGGVEIEQAADIGEVTTGATGETVFSANNDKTLFVNITVLETSKSYRNLAALMKLQEARIGPILPLPFLLVDAINGDTISSAYATFVARPGLAKGKTVGERVFRLALPGAAATAIYGALNFL